MAARKLNIRPDPDFSRFERVLKRSGIPDRVPFYELFSNIQKEVLKAIGKYQELPPTANTREEEVWLTRLSVNYMYTLGYDYVVTGGKGFGFSQKEGPKAMTREGERSYHKGDTCTIADWKDFEKYAWPDMKQVNYSPVEDLKKYLPEGMKAIGSCSGILENVMWLLGYERISYLLYDDEELVGRMFEAVATRIIEYLGNLASFDLVGAIQFGEDMGFKTQTMLSPAVYRKYVFPWHKKLVETVHRYGKPVILHSCGNLGPVLEDVLACGWDAKHSFEDAIEPVWTAKKNYGSRVALLGGFDVDKISRMTPTEVRKHTCFLIEKCAPAGGWALGTGNSVANYIPVENFLTMLETGYRYGRYY